MTNAKDLIGYLEWNVIDICRFLSSKWCFEGPIRVQGIQLSQNKQHCLDSNDVGYGNHDDENNDDNNEADDDDEDVNDPAAG